LTTIDSKKDAIPYRPQRREKKGVRSLTLKVHNALKIFQVLNISELLNVTFCIAGVDGVCAASICKRQWFFAERFVRKGAAPQSESKVWGIRLEDSSIVVGLFCCAQRAKVPPHRHI